MRAVNLLPKGTKRERKKLPIVPLVGMSGAVVMTMLLALMFTSKAAEVSQAQTQLDLTQQELASIPEPAPVDSAQPELRAAQSSRLAAVSGALGRRVTWDRVLRHFAQVLPTDVWLTSFTVGGPAAAAGVPGGTPRLQLSGYSYSHESVARLLARLAIVPDFTNVTLLNSSSTTLDGRKVVQFNLFADVRTTGASS
jgi:Tfp pilus assembly protein PilN